MTVNGTTLRARIVRSNLTVLGLTMLAFLLPSLVRAQQPAAEEKLREAKKTLELQLDGLQFQIKGSNPEAEKGQDEAKKLESELRKKADEVRDLERRLKIALDKAKMAHDAKPVAPPAKRIVYELVPGEKGSFILRPVAPQPQVEGQWRIQIAPNLEKVVPPPAINLTPKVRTEADGRTKNLEKRLDEIMKELEQLRKELKTPRPAPKPEEESQAAREQRIRAMLETRLRAEEASERLNAVEKERKEAAAAVEEAKLMLEKFRSVSAIGGTAAEKQYEARLAEAAARLANLQRTRLELELKEEIARAREAAERRKKQ